MSNNHALAEIVDTISQSHIPVVFSTPCRTRPVRATHLDAHITLYDKSHRNAHAKTKRLKRKKIIIKREIVRLISGSEKVSSRNWVFGTPVMTYRRRKFLKSSRETHLP